MSDEKKYAPEDDAFDLGAASPIDTTSRARNKTVMLTPEITGQVRARLSRPDHSKPAAAEEIARTTSPISRQIVEQTMPRHEDPVMDETPVVGYREEVEAAPVEPPYVPSVEPPAPVTTAREREYEEEKMVQQDTIIWSKQSPVAGMLVSYDVDPYGDVFVLRLGRLVVSTEPQRGGNSLVIVDDTVSMNHAIMRIGDQGDVQLLDQLSEFGTTVVKRNGEEVRLAGEKAVLGHGDVVRFGNRSFKVCLVA